jgi:DNA modification methylase
MFGLEKTVRIECTGATTVPLDDLKDLQGDLKNLSEENYVKLRNSMDEFGFSFPVFMWEDKDGIKWIVDAHQRIKTLRKMRSEGYEVPPLPADYIHAKDRIEAKKKLLVLNSRYGEITESGLTDFINEEGFEIAIEEMQDYLDYPEIDFSNEDPATNITEDEAPEVSQDPAKSELGKVYQLGRHRLMCGDATKIEDVEKLMNGQKADMIFTDPPYGYSYESNHQDKHKELMNDDKILDFLPTAYIATQENSAYYIFCGWQTVDKWVKLVQDNGLNIKNIIIWKKNNWSMGDLTGAYAGQYEMIIFAHKGRVELQGERERDIWEFDRVPPADHPTMKPVSLIAKAITKHLSNNILDLFGGSGSTLIACEQTNRTCYMMELDPKYVDVIRKRYAKFIGKENEWESITPGA